MKTKIGIITLLIAGLMILTAGLASAQEPNAISGTVTDAITGETIEGAKVQVDGSDPLISAQTDASGRYTLEGVPVGEQNITASAAGYDGGTVIAQISETDANLADLSLQPSAPETAPNSVTGAVTGAVTDATTGEPIVGATVQVDGSDPLLSAQTDAQGEYALEGVIADDQSFTASADQYESETVGALVSDTEGISVNFTLQPLVEQQEDEPDEPDGEKGAGKSAGSRKGYVGVFAGADNGSGTVVIMTKKGDIEIQIPDDGLEAITKRPGRSPGAPQEGDRVAVLVEFSEQGGELVRIARQIIVKPAPKPPTVGVVVNIATDEDGVRTLTIMRPNGKTKEVRLGSKSPPPEVGDLVTAFHGRDGDDEDGDSNNNGDRPPKVKGLVRAQEVRQRLEGFLEDLSNKVDQAIEKVEERLAKRLAKLAEKLESQAAKHANIIERISQSDKLPPEAVAGILNGLDRARRGHNEAKVKATKARTKSRPSRGPELQGNTGDSGSGNREDRGNSRQRSPGNNGSSDQGDRGNSGSSDRGGRVNSGFSVQGNRGNGNSGERSNRGNGGSSR